MKFFDPEYQIQLRYHSFILTDFSTGDNICYQLCSTHFASSLSSLLGRRCFGTPPAFRSVGVTVTQRLITRISSRNSQKRTAVTVSFQKCLYARVSLR
jgi:hypothetical protein